MWPELLTSFHLPRVCFRHADDLECLVGNNLSKVNFLSSVGACANPHHQRAMPVALRQKLVRAQNSQESITIALSNPAMLASRRLGNSPTDGFAMQMLGASKTQGRQQLGEQPRDTIPYGLSPICKIESTASLLLAWLPSQRSIHLPC